MSYTNFVKQNTTKTVNSIPWKCYKYKLNVLVLVGVQKGT